MKPKSGEGLRLLHVHAHPDDESSKGAATTARYVDEGVRVMVATCTGGERGSLLNPRMQALTEDPTFDIAATRTAEMDRAREILGIEQVWLGFVDSGYPEGDPTPPLPEGCFGLEDPKVAAGRLVKVIREFKPQVMTTYDANGGYPHPDHIMCHRISVEAFRAAADPDAWPEHGEPWQVSKLYYHMSFHRRRFEALERAMHEMGIPVPSQARPMLKEDERWDRLTTFVPCADYFEVRDKALLAHATQVDPDGLWFSIPLAVQKLGWPTEDYQLVASKVPVVIPEDDLFAGLRPEPIGPEFWI